MLLLLALALLLSGCSPSPPPPPVAAAPPDVTKEAWYAETVAQVTAMASQAEAAYRSGKSEEAAATITRSRPLIDRLLSATHPTLPAMEAISDLDQLYGRMLLANGHQVWARDFFQKNLARWSAWKPATADTARRLEDARSAVAECDRQMQNPGAR